MARFRAAHRVLIGVFAGLTMGASCSDETILTEVPPKTSSPLAQESVVLVEVEIPQLGWVTLPVPQAGIERFARKWCAFERYHSTDRIFEDDPGETDFWNDTFAAGALTGVDIGICVSLVNRERNEVCAGFLLEEAGRSPIPREFDSALYPGFGAIDFANLLLIPEAALKSALAKGSSEAKPDGSVSREDDALIEATSTLKLRFQPMEAPSRAAVLRGAYNRYREGAWVGHVMEDEDLNGGGTCMALFEDLPMDGLEPDRDGHQPMASDLVTASFLDAVTQVSGVIPRVVSAMRDSAQYQRRGGHDEQAEIATQWNGQVDSALAIAKFLGFGDGRNGDGSVTEGVMTRDFADECGGEHKWNAVGPGGIPVCPPIAEDEKTEKALTWWKKFKLKPLSHEAVDEFVDAYNEYLSTKLIKQLDAPLTKDEVLAKLGLSEENIIKAAGYLCQQSNQSVTFLTEIAEAPGKFYGVSKPPTPLPPGGVSGVFLGALDAQTSPSVGTWDYATGGAIKFIDMMKKTTSKLSSSIPAGEMSPKVVESVQDVVDALSVDAGGRRLQFVIGTEELETEGYAADHLAIIIHGIPVDDHQATEHYYAVQGWDGLKCAVDGDIDGAPCNPNDYLVDLNGPTSFSETADPAMSDLDGGYLYNDLTAVRRPGDATFPILVEHAIYVLRLEKGKFEAVGGVVPKPFTTFLNTEPEYGYLDPQYSITWNVTKVVFAPFGGTLQEVMASALTPSPDDCSKLQDTCAGIPAGIWPPLESEIVGAPSDAQNFESSWRYYLDLAKAASEEADKLGEEVISQGLEMDLRREGAQGTLEELCGADPTGCGFDPTEQGGLPKDDVLATLGDANVCLWYFTKTNGKPVACDRQGAGIPDSVPCPFVAEPTDATCLAVAPGIYDFEGVVGGEITYELIDRKLGLLKTQSSLPTNACGAFDRLRTDQDPLLEVPSADDEKKTLKRSEYIRTYIMPIFDPTRVADIAKNLKYEEMFADNYSLSYGGTEIFNTKRPAPGVDNDEVGAPCAIGADDLATGSSYWSQSVDCFVSGDPNCDGGVGQDGCEFTSENDISLDTEHDALKARWAWGFGRLRRSVAVLGVLTGQLGDNMKLMRIMTPFLRMEGNDDNLVANNAGYPCTQDLGSTSAEPPWVLHCNYSGDPKNRPMSRCVMLNGPGVGPDTNRTVSGRPVNFNGFLPNAIPEWPYFTQFFDGTKNAKTFPFFPILCPDPSCSTYTIGLDPQMPYCEMVDPEAIADWAFSGNPFATFDGYDVGKAFDGQSSGYIGASFAREISVKANQTWEARRNTMWQMPEEDDFCDKSQTGAGVGTSESDPAPKGAVWRALCHIGDSETLASVQSNPGYMQRAELPSSGYPFVSGATVGNWLTPTNSGEGLSKYGQMLFDLRKGNMRHTKIPFQYPLTQRNIFDALELACHASARSTVSVVDCKEASADDVLDAQSFDQLASILDCLGAQAARVGQKFVVGPISPDLLSSFGKGEAISSTSGLGGEYLKALAAQYSALTRIASAFTALRDAQTQLSIGMRTMQSINGLDHALDQAHTYEKVAAVLHGLASALDSIGSIDWSSGNAGAAMTAASLDIAGSAADVAALDWKDKADDFEIEQKLLALSSSMVKEVGAGRDAVKEMSLAMNDLTTASADMKLVKKQASKAASSIAFSDYAGDDQNDPQFVNVAMRRIYNTRLLRYEKARDRAKRLAYLARRAIELRFGIDMQRMKVPMTLVEAPNTWVNRICTIEGIDYAKIREPNSEEPVEGFDFGDVPLPGDDFADEYVGDYVRKLEDFVSSYPIDFPLKDGDDTAVISLADDIMKVTSSCTQPGPNLLYWSTEFDANDEVAGSSSRGWFVDGCDYNYPADGGAEAGADGGDAGVGAPWNGCVVAKPAFTSTPSGDGGLDGGVDASGDGGPVGVTTEGLPPGSLAYLVRNEPCIEGTAPSGEPIVCPDVGTFQSRGYLTQWLTGLDTGIYVASVYALELATAEYDSGAGERALMRVVRSSDSAVVGEMDLDPLTTTTWTRFELAFGAEDGEDYRLEILPASVEQALPITDAGEPTWPGVYLAAAQVDRAGLNEGNVTAAGAWVRTDSSRDIVSPVCNENRGAALRSRFTRRCEYTCAGGIGGQCAAIDKKSVPTACFYEAQFPISLEEIESGELIPTGQIAIGNFNFRHNTISLNAVGSGVTSCEGKPSSCYYNGFLEYTLFHSGDTAIRNHTGWSLPAHLDRAVIEHGKMLAAERVITNPPSSSDLGLLETYTKREYKGRPMMGSYTLRVWDRPGLRWDQIDDIQLVWKYHYWTRFQK
jgi:hypothetical protein